MYTLVLALLYSSCLSSCYVLGSQLLAQLLTSMLRSSHLIAAASGSCSIRRKIIAEIHHLSHSGKKSWLDCGEQYRLLKIENLPDIPGVYNAGGSAVHAMIEAISWESFGSGEAQSFDYYFDKEIAEAEESSGIPKEEWRVAGKVTKLTPNKDDITWWRQNGPAMVRRWCNWLDNSPYVIAVSPNGEPAIELEIEPQFGRVLGKGFIDCVLESTIDGHFTVVDYKTGKPPKGPEQLAGYAQALTQDGWDVHHGGYFMARGGILSYDMDLSPLMGERLVYEYEQVWDAIKADVFIAKPSGLCKDWCSVNKYCAWGGYLTDTSHLPFPEVRP